MVINLSNSQPQGPKFLETLENKTIDGNANTIHVKRGTASERTTYPLTGDQYYDTDLGSLFNWNGTEWVRIYTPPPKVDSISPLSAPVAGTVITVAGADFSPSAVVSFIGTNGFAYNATLTSYVGSTSLSATTPALQVAYEPYDVRVTNLDGQQGIKENILDVGGTPTWNTASGSLGIFTESQSISISVSASDPDGTSLVYTSINLPSGLSINSSSGLISGTAALVATSTTYSFDVVVTDGANSSSRSFSITVNPKATVSGGTATSDSTYYYRTFTANDSLVVTGGNLTADILVVAGGGGTGWDVGGGGGGGGVCHAEQYLLSPSSYGVTVGAGGASLTASPAGGGRGSNGGNSVFGSIIAYGGGGGGSYPTPNGNGQGANGGSGGGAGDANFSGGSSTQTSGTGYTGYGYAGGASGASWGSGGGGGAGGPGANGISSTPVDGGLPYTSLITGSSVKYAGGGYGNADSGTIYATGYNKSNTYLGYYGFGANGTGVPNGSPYTGNPGVVIVRYLKTLANG